MFFGRIKVGMDRTTLKDNTDQTSSYAYAKPFNVGQENATETVQGPDSSADKPGTGGQYSLLGHDKKYENVGLEEIVAAAP